MFVDYGSVSLFQRKTLMSNIVNFLCLNAGKWPVTVDMLYFGRGRMTAIIDSHV